MESHKRDPTTPIFLDLEGHDLGGRNGRFDLMELFVPNANIVYLVRIDELGKHAFECSGKCYEISLEEIFKARDLRKAFWDCRSDSRALFGQCGIQLDAGSIDDVQLLEIATAAKPKNRKKVKSLGMAVGMRINLPPNEAEWWRKVKDEGFPVMQDGPNWRQKTQALVAKAKVTCDNVDSWERVDEKLMFTPEDLEDDWVMAEAWRQHPLPQALVDYAVGDVIVLPALYEQFYTHERLTEERKKAVAQETAQRILDSQEGPLRPYNNSAPKGWDDKDW